MYLSQLDILQVRNLQRVQIACHPTANVIYGANGSGKTSVLEAIYLLGRGRSFKHRDLRLVVNSQADELVVSGRVVSDASVNTGHQLGVRRTAQGRFEARLDGKTIPSAAQLAIELPLQFIDAHSLSLLEGGPSQRRRFLDWGVFHVEQSYTNIWRRFQKALKQRNQLLRHGRIDEDLLRAWTVELIPLAEKMSESRQRYLQQLTQQLALVAESLGILGLIGLEYYRGWAEDLSLAQVFESQHKRDMTLGATGYGAHRADIKIKIDGVPAAERLSRGQIKLLVYALKLAQAAHYQSRTGRGCLFLLDDLPAELDDEHLGQVVAYLNQLDCQYFVTGVDKRHFEQLFSAIPHKMFHMEQGLALNG